MNNVISNINFLNKKIVKKMFDVLFAKKKQVVTPREQKLLDELVDQWSSLQIDKLNATCEWNDIINNLIELSKQNDPMSFLRWELIQNTMFIAYSPYIKKELKFLKRLEDWKPRWTDAIRESSIGNPVPYTFYPKSSANLIHHAYHLAKFEHDTGKSLKNIDLIFEFGGGYGSMCRLFHNLGFKGNYIIFDFPYFSALQKFYLKSLSLPVCEELNEVKSTNNIYCLSDIGELQRVLDKSKKQTKNDLFLATWSLSESPLDLRKSLEPIISKFENTIVAFAGSFCGIDNELYFDEFKDNFINTNWKKDVIEYIPENYYLFGY